MNNLTLPKQSRVVLIVLVAAATLALVYFWPRNPNPLRAIPAQSAVVAEFKGLAQAGQLVAQLPDPTWKALLQNTLLQACWQDAAAAERLFQHDEATRTAFANNALAAALTLNPADSLHPLFALDLGARPNLLALLESNPVAQKFFPSSFHGRTLYTVHLSRRERLVLTRVDHLLLFSRFSYLVEDAVAQLESGDNWWDDRDWRQHREPAALKISMRPAVLGTAAAGRLGEAWRSLPDLLRRNVSWLGFSWDGTNLRGAARASGFLEKMAEWGDAPPEKIFTVLPDNTAVLAAVGVERRDAFWDNFTVGANADFQKFILPWLGQEAAFVLTEPFSADLKEEQFVVLAMRDSAVARERLDAYGAQRGVLRAYDYQTFEVRQFLSQAALAPLLGDDPVAFRNPACVTLGSYVVFAGSSAALELWIDKYIVNETLSNAPDFLQQRQKLSARGTVSLLLNTSYWPGLLKKIALPEVLNANADETPLVAKAGFLGLDLRPAKHTGWLDIFAAAQPLSGAAKTATSSSILWKTPLGAAAATTPSVVSTGGEEAVVLVQDVRNELYCLRASGTVAWRRQMSARILSTIQGIDFQNNGTNFFLFNTADQIWLLDAEGHDVDGFPLKLQSPATNGLTVVDFDENHRYSFFVACANNNLYGYDQFGRPLPGWNPQGGVGAVVQPLLHFQQQEKDYLVALSRTGRLSVFGRNGAARFPAIQLDGKFAGPLQADAGSKSPRIVCANTAGRIFVCTPDGQTFSINLTADASGPAHLVFMPLSGDERYDYALLKGGKLTAKSYAGAALQPLFSTQFADPPDTLFAATGNRIGALNRSKRQIFLLDGKGALHPDFPLAGDTPFIMDALFTNRREQVLLVGNGSSMYAYLIR